MTYELLNYFDNAYWDNRYSRDAGSFDWYQRYKDLAPLLKDYINTSDKVLMVGCGSALLSEEMVKDGYRKIMNIDISDVLIRFLTDKYKNMKQLQFKRMDVRYMKGFKDRSYSCVLDKGMFDNLMCGAGAQACVTSMLSEVYRLLKPGGIYFLVSCADPRDRMPCLKTNLLPWKSITLHTISRTNHRRNHEAKKPVRDIIEPLLLYKDLTLGPMFNLEDPDMHYVYVCLKVGGPPRPPRVVIEPPPILVPCEPRPYNTIACHLI